MMMFYKQKGYRVFRNNNWLNIDEMLLEISERVKELWFIHKDKEKVMKEIRKEYKELLDDYEIIFNDNMIIVKEKNHDLDSYECEAVKIVNIDFSEIIMKAKKEIAKIRYETKKWDNYKVEINTNYATVMSFLDWILENLENIDDYNPETNFINIEKHGEVIKIEMPDFEAKIKI